MSPTQIVVTGATGHIGRRTVLELARRGAAVTAFVRDPARAADLAAAGARVRRGSYEDAQSVRAAVTGADTAVVVTAGPDQDAQAQTIVAAAKAGGVRKMVLVSGTKASADAPTAPTRAVWRNEELVRASGLAYVILRGSPFMDNLLPLVPAIRAQGKIYYGIGDAKIGMIDTRDLADAAVAAATSATWDGQVLELTGPAAIDFHAVARAVSGALGREIGYVAIPPAAVGEAAREAGAAPWLVDAIVEFCTANSHGWSDFVTATVAAVTGHPPRSIDDFVREVLAPAVRAA